MDRQRGPQDAEYSQEPDAGLTRPELSAYLRRLAALELEQQENVDEFRKFRKLAFLNGRASALFAVAELVERGEIRAGLLSEPIERLHVVHQTPPTSPAMPND